MLRVDVRRIGPGGVATEGVLEPGSPVLEGLDLVLDGPVQVAGRLQGTEDDSYLWRGEFRVTVVGECRRCLVPVKQQIDDAVDLLFSADPELLEDPSVYPLAADTGAVDVGAAVREEIALRVTAFPLCDDECKGLCPRCGESLNAGPCGCTDAGTNT